VRIGDDLSTRASIQALEDLGFTRVEAEVYVHLIHSSPATGYQIAKAINRTRGATYKVLATLASKGAVESDSQKASQWRAVPPAEFLNQLERRFIQGRQRATDALEAVKPPAPDYHIYQLRTVGQVYERARSMLTSCKEFALLDVFPLALDKLREDIAQAIKRGIKVAIDIYAPDKVPGARMIRTYEGFAFLERLPVNWITLSSDAEEMLIAVLSEDDSRVLQATWSANTFLARVLSSYLRHSFLAEDFITMMESGASFKQIKSRYKSHFAFIRPFTSPGYSRMRKDLGLD
jgi:sugar-specific transcriptional regulator TrmB